MTPEIEKRIKAVKAGRVPAGYKKTKVGIVPKEWDECKLSHYLSVSKEKNTELKYSKEDVFSISGELGIVNQIELLGRSYAGASVAPYGVVKPNDIVYTKSPLKANPYGVIKTSKTGKTGIVSTLYAIFNCRNNVDPSFIQYYFESDKKLNDYLLPLVNIGAKHDMKISDDNSLNGIVVFPPLSEQKKIVEILSTQDKIILFKKNTIDEKKKIKKYLEQLLLERHSKNKKRFLEIENRIKSMPSCPTLNNKKKDEKSDCWKNVKLGMIFENRIETNCDSLNLLSITAEKGVIPRSEIEGKDNSSEDKSKYKHIRAGDIGYNTMRMWQGVCALSQYDGIVSPAYTILNPSKEICASYFSYLFKTPFMVNKFYKNSQGLVDDTRCLKYEWFKKIEISIPPLSEQIVIADILSTVNEEISLLQRDLEQEKLKKKSLMQLLLTGLVRV